MRYSFPKKLIKWFIRFFLLSSVICFFLLFLVFKIFFGERSFFDFLPIFLIGFFISFFIFSILFLRLLDPIGRVVLKIKDMAYGQKTLDENVDSFLNEPGEFYEVNKNLSRIHSHLKWQKRIISQESSELEAVISAVNGAIIAVDRNQKILFFNTKAMFLFDQEKKIKKDKFLLSQFVRNPDVLKCYTKCLEEGVIIKKKLKIDSDSYDELDYEITVAPLKESQSVQGAVGLFYDITNIEKVEQSHIDFISNISHELRTPLTMIRGYVQTVLSDLEINTKQQTKNFLETINKNVERLVSLLNHFLEMSHLDATESLKTENLSTEEVTRSVVSNIKIDKHKLQFTFDVKVVRADRRFLEQILYNLLDNAVRYVPASRLIEILWAEKDEFTLLTVKDHGEGIPRQHRERLFERFYRVDSARTSSKGGSGIGLSIAKQLLEKHGGSIELISRDNEGSEFICRFPK